jgi:hypothetical protein
MIDDENWSYQILNYVMPANGPTGSKRLTWGSNWGRPGGFDNWGSTDAQNNPLKKNEYSQHSTDPLGQVFSGNRADGMLVAYSVFVVLGTHSGGYKGGTVGQVVSQMENINRATLSTSVGTVKLFLDSTADAPWTSRQPTLLHLPPSSFWARSSSAICRLTRGFATSTSAG